MSRTNGVESDRRLSVRSSSVTEQAMLYIYNVLLLAIPITTRNTVVSTWVPMPAVTLDMTLRGSTSLRPALHGGQETWELRVITTILDMGVGTLHALLKVKF